MVLKNGNVFKFEVFDSEFCSLAVISYGLCMASGNVPFLKFKIYQSTHIICDCSSHVAMLQWPLTYNLNKKSAL